MIDKYYDAFEGKKILNKYIKNGDRRYIHSVGVANFSKRVAARIKHKHPELSWIDPQFSAFLGYVHDIGYSVNPMMHELHTIDLLIKNENIPEEIAWKTIHGQIVEQYGRKFGNPDKFYPKELEGVILSYADMTVNVLPMHMEERVEEIKERLETSSLIQERKDEIINGLNKAFPRFQRYEKIIFELAGVWKYSHFGFKKKKKRNNKHFQRAN